MTEEVKLCKWCKKPLTGRQREYCCTQHMNYDYYRTVSKKAIKEQQKKTNTKVCVRCGKEFVSMHRAQMCPECKELEAIEAKTNICAWCGKKYMGGHKSTCSTACQKKLYQYRRDIQSGATPKQRPRQDNKLHDRLIECKAQGKTYAQAQMEDSIRMFATLDL